jgi:hypothetical protein
MLKTPDLPVTHASSRGSRPMQGGASALPRTRAWWWVMMALIGLVTALAVGLIVVVGARRRGTAARAIVGGLAPAQGWDAGRCTGAEAPTATELRGSARDPGRSFSCAADSRAPGPQPDGSHPLAAALSGSARPAAGAADPPPRISMLFKPRPVPVGPAAGAAEPPARDVRSLGRELFAGSGSPMTLAATAAMGWGRSITRPPAWTATTWGGLGARGPPTRTSSLPPASATSPLPAVRRASGAISLRATSDSICFRRDLSRPTW